jgi:dTDP-4-dehydrorhamnose 3,5-epimerase
MPQGWLETGIAGVVRRELQTHADERGAFTELWRAGWTTEMSRSPFVQANLSRSRTDVLRGMHFHRRQSDLWVVVEGRALVAVADLRDVMKGAAPQPAVDTFELSAGGAVFIPELVAHGFLAISELALVYLVSNEYDGTDELGFAWDDPLAAIPWPARDPVLSGRDRSNPSLREAIAAAGGG